MNRIMDIIDAPGSWFTVKLVLLRQPDATEKLVTFCALALMSLLATYYAAVLVSLHDHEPEPRSWKDLHVGAEHGIVCETFSRRAVQSTAATLENGSREYNASGVNTRGHACCCLWRA